MTFTDKNPTWKTRKDFEFRIWVFNNWFDVPYPIWAVAGNFVLTGYREVG